MASGRATRVKITRPYKLRVNFYDSPPKTFTFRSHLSAMNRVDEYRRYLGGWILNMTLTDFDSGKVIAKEGSFT